MKKWFEMTAEEQEKFLSAAVSAGRITVAADVFEALSAPGAVIDPTVPPGSKLELDVVRDPDLPPGTVLVMTMPPAKIDWAPTIKIVTDA